MKWIKRILFAVLVVALLALLGWSFMPRPLEVETAQVTRGQFVQTIDEDGRTRVRDRYVVSAPLVGRLQRISLQEGDTVQKDTVLATIAPTAPALLDARTEQELTARVGAAEAGKLRATVRVERAQVALAQAQADFERTGKLASAAFVSPTKLEADRLNVALNEKEVDAAKQEVHVAEHDLEVARAALVQMRSPPPATPGKLWQVRAPVTGRVLKVVQKNEGVVTVGTPLLELGNARELEAVVDVLTSDAVRIRPGAQVLFERWGGADTLQGQVRLVEPSAFTKISALGVEEQRVNVIIDMVSPPEKWQAVSDGYRVEARVVIDERMDANLVPVSALFRDGEQWAVFVLSKDRAEKRAVQLGPRSRLLVVVERNLEVGDSVIIYPGDAIKNGVKVKVRTKP
ncbi:MAG: efflux RND transporter periplasmic adaptor subunit [Burkholderiaceae bacterium]